MIPPSRDDRVQFPAFSDLLDKIITEQGFAAVMRRQRVAQAKRLRRSYYRAHFDAGLSVLVWIMILVWRPPFWISCPALYLIAIAFIDSAKRVDHLYIASRKFRAIWLKDEK